MELLVTLYDKGFLKELIQQNINGIVFGGQFSNKFNFTDNDIKEINDICLNNNVKRYISIDAFISESQLENLHKYLEYISSLNVDGVYFNDMAILKNSSKYGLDNKLIYDPVTLLTNSKDIGFYINKNIDVVIARELTLEEIIEIVKNYPYKLDMQIFGHLRMSYSKRKFLTNYFKEINKNIDINNNNDIRIVEETRSYELPIKETENGTCIYSDYILLMYEEFAYLKQLLKRVIIDSEFVEKDILLDFIRDAKRISSENSEFLKISFTKKYNDVIFSSGYLYKKTVDKKGENEED